LEFTAIILTSWYLA